MYVLLMVFVLSSSNTGAMTTLSQPFDTKDSCEAAMASIKKQVEEGGMFRPRVVAATCTRK